jgi:hypothetical protein
MQLLPVTENEVKAQISRPAPREMVPTDSVCRIHGAAWAGEAEVTQVQVSADGGETWETAGLLGAHVPYAWRLWEHHWRTPAQPGPRALMARAMDSRGRVQPLQRDSHRGSYVISHAVQILVEVSDKLAATSEPFAI